MGSDLKNKEIDSLRERCQLLRKKLKDSVFKLSEFASMCSCYGELDDEDGIVEKGSLELED